MALPRPASHGGCSGWADPEAGSLATRSGSGSAWPASQMAAVSASAAASPPVASGLRACRHATTASLSRPDDPSLLLLLLLLLEESSSVLLPPLVASLSLLLAASLPLDVAALLLLDVAPSLEELLQSLAVVTLLGLALRVGRSSLERWDCVGLEGCQLGLSSVGEGSTVRCSLSTAAAPTSAALSWPTKGASRLSAAACRSWGLCPTWRDARHQGSQQEKRKTSGRPA